MLNKIYISLLATLLLSGNTVLADVTLSSSGDDRRILSITDLEINGLRYDATFIYDSTFNELNISQFVFSSQSTARQAADEIISAIDDANISIPDTNFDVTNSFRIPHATITTNLLTSGFGSVNVQSSIVSRDPLTYLRSNATNLTDGDFSIGANNAFVTFTAVPEPTSLFFLTITGVAGLNRRNRREIG